MYSLPKRNIQLANQQANLIIREVELFVKRKAEKLIGPLLRLNFKSYPIRRPIANNVKKDINSNYARGPCKLSEHLFRIMIKESEYCVWQPTQAWVRECKQVKLVRSEERSGPRDASHSLLPPAFPTVCNYIFIPAPPF